MITARALHTSALMIRFQPRLRKSGQGFRSYEDRGCIRSRMEDGCPPQPMAYSALIFDSIGKPPSDMMRTCAVEAET